MEGVVAIRSPAKSGRSSITWPTHTPDTEISRNQRGAVGNMQTGDKSEGNQV